MYHWTHKHSLFVLIPFCNLQEECTELENIIAIERDKYAEQSKEDLHRLKAAVTEEAIDSMHDSLKDMALQNMVMKKVRFHLVYY